MILKLFKAKFFDEVKMKLIRFYDRLNELKSLCSL